MTTASGSYRLDLNLLRKDFREAPTEAHGEVKARTEEL